MTHPFKNATPASPADTEFYLANKQPSMPFKIVPHSDGDFLISTAWGNDPMYEHGMVFKLSAEDFAAFFTIAYESFAERRAQALARGDEVRLRKSQPPSSRSPIDIDFSLDGLKDIQFKL